MRKIKLKIFKYIIQIHQIHCVYISIYDGFAIPLIIIVLSFIITTEATITGNQLLIKYK